MDVLFNTLSLRPRPEDVALILLRQHGKHLSKRSQEMLKPAAQYALRVPRSSMATTFSFPADFANNIPVFKDLFPDVALTDETGSNESAFGTGLAQAGLTIGKSREQNSFLFDRHNKIKRAALGMDISKKQYNKRFRFLRRMEAKFARLMRNRELADLFHKGYAGLAGDLDFDAFSEDGASATFIAYYTARRNMRSVFTFGKQKPPFDVICESLLATCRARVTTNWFAIAHVYATPEVLAQLSEKQKGYLLGRWYGILQRCATQLKSVWSHSNIDRKTMIVKRGNDSSTWNLLAGAWNQARKNWIALNHAMGTEAVLDQMCFGKVLRLMAADVVWGHSVYGNGLDPDTAVWNTLPLPWEVFEGDAVCTRGTVAAACRHYGVDPEKKGWIAPPPNHAPVPYSITPELVHGVIVSSPELATALKKAGFFSGKPKFH